MNAKKYRFFYLIVLSTLLSLAACNTPADHSSNEVKIWTLDGPKGLNPYNTNDATATLIEGKIYQKLLNIDHESYELIPVLARKRPDIEVLGDSGMRMTFELRPEAKWDNGKAITAKDVVFSFKALICPHINDQALKPYLDFVEGFQLYDDDPLKFTILCNQVNMRAEYSAGHEVWIIPDYVFDPEGLLNAYSYTELKNNKKLENNPDILQFADRFNSPLHNHDSTGISGSGPYALQSWQSGQRLRLIRKKIWWGDQIQEDGNEYFEAYPEIITYEIINDQTAAITALKGEQIDVMRSIKANAYKNDLMKNKKLKKHFNLFEAPFFAFSYLGLNLHNPKLSNQKTREALACLVDYDRLMKDVLSGFGERVVGPVHPLMEKFYNDTIKLYQYNLEKAKTLLAEAGWVDSDGDNVLDREIDGETIPFKLSYMYNTGNSEREKIGLILQESFKQAGIELELNNIDWSIYLDKLADHDFEMYYGVWGGEPAPEDYKQIYYTSSSNGGSNYTYFGNAESDALIDKINRTIDDDTRADLVRQFQVVLHHTISYIFLWAPMNRIAVHKRFENTHISGYMPGYWIPGFKLSEVSK